MGFTYAYVYGLPEDAQLVEQVKSCAKAGAAVKFAKGMKIALIGPRQTCRVAGPQDMTVEEWDFLKMTGVTFIYFEMEEVPDEAKRFPTRKPGWCWICCTAGLPRALPRPTTGRWSRSWTGSL